MTEQNARLDIQDVEVARERAHYKIVETLYSSDAAENRTSIAVLNLFGLENVSPYFRCQLEYVMFVLNLVIF